MIAVPQHAPAVPNFQWRHMAFLGLSLLTTRRSFSARASLTETKRRFYTRDWYLLTGIGFVYNRYPAPFSIGVPPERSCHESTCFSPGRRCADVPGDCTCPSPIN